MSAFFCESDNAKEHFWFDLRTAFWAHIELSRGITELFWIVWGLWKLSERSNEPILDLGIENHTRISNPYLTFLIRFQNSVLIPYCILPREYGVLLGCFDTLEVIRAIEWVILIRCFDFRFFRVQVDKSTDRKMGFHRFRDVWRDQMKFRVHSWCIRIRFGIPNAPK